jgi:hypothetical protein
MKRIILWMGFGVCVLGAAIGVSAAGGRTPAALNESAQVADHPDGGCSNATLRGAYGFFRTGATAQGPLAAVGVGTYDGVGFFTVTQTTSRNGVFTQGSFGGTYEIYSDCSGRLLSIDGQTVTAYLSVVDGGKEIFMLSASAGNSITGISKRVRGRNLP